jgi:hypothetical protein
MGHISVLERTNIGDKFARGNFDEKALSYEKSRTSPVLENILSEGGDDFFRYLIWIGLAKEPNLMVLSSMHHYYYDHKDMIGIRTLINLKKLNQVKHLDSFLHILFRILPSKSYFVGCFKSTSQNSKGVSFSHPVKFFNGFINIFDSRTERNLSKKSVIKILEENSFKVIDITDINGVTYFWAQNIRRTGE